MDLPSSNLLRQFTLCAYAAGVVGSLLALRRERIANPVGFGCATMAAVSGIGAALLALTVEATPGAATFELWPSLIPYLQITIKLDPLGAFFFLIGAVGNSALPSLNGFVSEWPIPTRAMQSCCTSANRWFRSAFWISPLISALWTRGRCTRYSP
jgi:formate hydrogenlyase subunit 3/multisubunit Na+/H+ antiporter MnhD subunit